MYESIRAYKCSMWIVCSGVIPEYVLEDMVTVGY